MGIVAVRFRALHSSRTIVIAHTSSRYPRYLLDLDPELAAGLDARMRIVARRSATVVTFVAEPGKLDLQRWLRITAGGPGLLVLSGALVSYARVLDRLVAEIVGSGDLLHLAGDGASDAFLDCDLSWSTLQPTRFAILDARFADQVRRWPQITHALLRRAERRLEHLAVQRAIAAQPRLELRLVLLLWHLAGRWGKLEPGGVRLPLSLTHILLGRLVGAERPSVTHALKRLAGAGWVKCGQDGWHLRGTPRDHLAALGGGQEAHRVGQEVHRVGHEVRRLMPATRAGN
jgi:CRP/FNR family transcriptional regulator, cyclic AMP receptor protein